VRRSEQRLEVAEHVAHVGDLARRGHEKQLSVPDATAPDPWVKVSMLVLRADR